MRSGSPSVQSANNRSVTCRPGWSDWGRAEGWRRGRRRILGKRLRIIERLKSEGLNNRAIAQRLGVNERAISRVLGPSKGEDFERLSLVRTASFPESEPPPLSTSSVLSEAVIEESAAVTSSRQDPASHSIQLGGAH